MMTFEQYMTRHNELVHQMTDLEREEKQRVSLCEQQRVTRLATLKRQKEDYMNEYQRQNNDVHHEFSDAIHKIRHEYTSQKEQTHIAMRLLEFEWKQQLKSGNNEEGGML